MNTTIIADNQCNQCLRSFASAAGVKIHKRSCKTIVPVTEPVLVPVTEDVVESDSDSESEYEDHDIIYVEPVAKETASKADQNKMDRMIAAFQAKKNTVVLNTTPVVVVEAVVEAVVEPVAMISAVYEVLSYHTEDEISFTLDTEEESFTLSNDSCLDCGRVFTCPCRHVTVEDTVTADVRFRELESTTVSQIDTTDSIINLYVDKTHKEHRLVIVGYVSVQSIAYRSIPCTIPSTSVVFDTVQFPYTDVSQGSKTVTIPVKRYDGPLITVPRSQVSVGDAEYQRTHMMVTGNNQKATISKLIHDTGMRFKSPEGLRYCYYDIETYSTRDTKEVPMWTNSQDHISTIQYRIGDERVILVNNAVSYGYDSTKLSGVKIEMLPNEQAVARAFMMMLHGAGHMIVIGYNASGSIYPRLDAAGRYVDIQNSGYDLPWILNRSNQGWTPIHQRFCCKYLGATSGPDAMLKMAGSISSIVQLPRIIFAEAMRYITDDLLMTKLPTVSLKLGDVLDAYAIPQSKLSIDFAVQTELLLTRGSDITDLLVYGMRDVDALQALVEKISTIHNNVALCEVWNIPLSWCMHATQAYGLQHMLQQRYREAGYLVGYLSRDEESSLKGAYTAATPGFYESMLQLDYASMYPNIMIQWRMNPETVAVDGTNHCNLHDEVQPIQYSFRAQHGVLSNTIASIYNDRVQLKMLMGQAKASGDKEAYARYDRLQYTAKIAINTSFGLSCNARSPLFCIAVGASITGMGRQVIQQTNVICEDMGLKVVSNDTDACNILLPPTVKDQHDVANVAASVNAAVSATYRYTDDAGIVADHLTLGYDEIVHRCYVMARKAYVWSQAKAGAEWHHHTCRPEGFVIPTVADAIKSRGIVYSGLNTSGIALLRSMVNQFMTMDLSIDVPTWFQQQGEHHTTIVRDAIARHDTEALLPYCDKKKVTRGSNVCTAVITTWPQLSSASHVELVYGTDKAVASAAIPIDMLTATRWSRLSVDRIVETLMSRMRKVVKSELGQKQSWFKEQQQDLLESLEDDMVHVRVEEPGSRIRYIPMNVDREMLHATILSAPKRSFHEVITQDRIRWTVDVDHCQHDDSIDTIVSTMRTMLGSYMRTTPVIRVLKNSSKNAYHVYTNVEVSLVLARSLAHQLQHATGMNRSVIDDAIYRARGSLRLADCCKITQDGVLQQGTQYMLPKGATLCDYMMTSINGCESLVTPLHLQRTLALDDEYVQRTGIKASQQHAIAMLSWCRGQKIPVSSIDADGCFLKMRTTEPYTCPIHGRVHESDNCYGIITKDGIRIRCYRSVAGEQTASITIAAEVPVVTMHDTIKSILSADIRSLDNAQLQSSQYLVLPERLTPTVFIRSALGTGKTHALSALLQQRQCNTMVLSHRITFTQSMLTRYPGAVSYADITGTVDFNAGATLLVQVDSLGRVPVTCIPEILVLDEIESLITQLNSSICKRTKVYETVQHLIRSARQIIVMDGYLQQTTVDLINDLRQQQHIIVENTVAPYTGTIATVTITDERLSVAAEIAAMIKTEHQAGNKVAVSVSSIKQSDILTNLCRLDGMTVLHLHGDNTRRHEDGMLHQDYKAMVIPSINEHVAQHDVTIYTGTVSAGIDVQVPVSLTIGWLYKGTTDAMQFVQGLYRFRNTKAMRVILPGSCQDHNTTPADLCPIQYQTVLASSFNEQMMLWLEARIATIKSNTTGIVLQQLRRIGCTIEMAQTSANRDHRIVQIAQDITEASRATFQPITDDDFTAYEQHRLGQSVDIDRHADAFKTMSALFGAHLSKSQILSAHEHYAAIHEIEGKDTIEQSVAAYLHQNSSAIARFNRVQKAGDLVTRFRSDVKNRVAYNVIDTKVQLQHAKRDAYLQAIAAVLPDMAQGITIDDPSLARAVALCQGKLKAVDIKSAYAIRGMICTTRVVKRSQRTITMFGCSPMVSFN